jgi:hypothetical protein
MKILKTLVTFPDGIYAIDTIEYEGDLWLVPEWIDGTPSEGYSKPVRIIRMPPLQQAGPSVSADYIVSNPLPKGVFEGQIPTEFENVYAVIEHPDIVIETPPTLH